MRLYERARECAEELGREDELSRIDEAMGEVWGLKGEYLPSADSYHEVPELPLLGSGKLDLKRIKQIAEKAFAVRS